MPKPESSAQNIYHLIEAAIVKTTKKHGRKTADINFSNLIADLKLESSENNAIAELNFGTLYRTHFQNARKAVQNGNGDSLMRISPIYLNSLSQFVHGVDFEEFYGDLNRDTIIKQQPKSDFQNKAVRSVE